MTRHNQDFVEAVYRLVLRGLLCFKARREEATTVVVYWVYERIEFEQ